MRYVSALQQRQTQGFFPVVADLKCRSPKEGILMEASAAPGLANTLKVCGCPALSVVTEAEHFGGSLKLLEDVVVQTGLPVLRKDFIRTRDEIMRSADAGASAVLLIVSMLDPATLYTLYETALTCGLTPLVETHTPVEAALANALHPSFVGINNRDILSLELDDGTVASTEELIGSFSGSPFVISESAILTREDVRRARDAGAHGVLVGTALLKAQDVFSKYTELSHPCSDSNLCG